MWRCWGTCTSTRSSTGASCTPAPRSASTGASAATRRGSSPSTSGRRAGGSSSSPHARCTRSRWTCRRRRIPPPPAEVKDALVRLRITANEGQRLSIDENRITARLETAFHHDVFWNLPQREVVRGGEEFHADPLTLFEGFVAANFGTHPHREAVAKEGAAILKEVLG